MTKCITKIRDWIVENPDKLIYGVAGAATVGTLIIFNKLFKYDSPKANIEKDYSLYSIGFIEGGHKACTVIRESLIKQFGEDKGQEIANMIADTFEKTK